jgi:site-specific recombinase XerD
MYKRPGRSVWYASLSDTEKHISLKTEDEERAREAFAQLIAERGHRELEADERTLVELWKATRERADTNNTPKTAYELHLNLRRIVTWCEQRKVVGSRQVDKQIVEDYKSARRFDQVSAARINRELDSWRRMMKMAVELNAAHPRVLEAFVKLREPRPDPHGVTLNKAQCARLLKEIAQPGYRALARAALGSGLRDEELRHVEVADVRTHEVSVTPKPGWATKSHHYRVVPISAPTRKALLTWIEARDSSKLNIDKKRVWVVLQAACAAAKVPPTSLHELRRAGASHWYDAGVPLKVISSWLGHADVATTERYLRLTGTKVPTGVKLPF